MIQDQDSIEIATSAQNIIDAVQKGIRHAEEFDTSASRIKFLSRSNRPGYDIVFGWGNTVVHVSLDGKTDVLQDLNKPGASIQYIVEQFRYLIVFYDLEKPKIYKNGKFQRTLPFEFENFTSKGVQLTPKFIYYTM